MNTAEMALQLSTILCVRITLDLKFTKRIT